MLAACRNPNDGLTQDFERLESKESLENQEPLESKELPGEQRINISLSTLNLSTQLPSLLGSVHKHYRLAGEDAEYFQLNEIAPGESSLTLAWKTSGQVTQQRAYRLQLIEEDPVTQETRRLILNIEAKLPEAIALIKQAITTQHPELSARPLRFKIDPKDYRGFYLAFGQQVLAIKQLLDRRWGYLLVDCEEFNVLCRQGFPEDFALLSLAGEERFEPLALSLTRLAVDSARCEPTLPESMRPLHKRGGDHDYVVTRVDAQGRALNGAPEFQLLTDLEQGMCFAKAYLYDDLARIANAPVTHQHHQDSLPEDMIYPRQDYQLMLNADFEKVYRREDTKQLLADQGVRLGVRFGEGDPYDNQDPSDDPVFVEDGKLWHGLGVRGADDADNPGSRYECDPERLVALGVNRAEAFNPDKCLRYHAAQLNTQHFKYGFWSLTSLRCRPQEAVSRLGFNCYRPITRASGAPNTGLPVRAPRAFGPIKMTDAPLGLVFRSRILIALASKIFGVLSLRAMCSAANCSSSR